MSSFMLEKNKHCCFLLIILLENSFGTVALFVHFNFTPSGVSLLHFRQAFFIPAQNACVAEVPARVIKAGMFI